METKKLKLGTLISGVILLVLVILGIVLPSLDTDVMRRSAEMFVEDLHAYVNALAPLAFAAFIVCMIRENKERTYGGKWGVYAITLFALQGVHALAGVVSAIAYDYGVLYLLAKIFVVSGFVLVLMSLLNDRFVKFKAFGLVALAAGNLVTIIWEVAEDCFESGTLVFALLGLVFLAVLAFCTLPEKVAKLLRNLAVLFIVLIALFGIGDGVDFIFTILGVVAWIAFAFHLVPGHGKMPKTLTVFVGILYAVLAVFTLLKGIEMHDAQVAKATVLLIFFAFIGLALLAVGFVLKKYEKLTALGYLLVAMAALMEIASVIYSFFTYALLRSAGAYIFSATFVLLIGVLLLGAIAVKRDGENVGKLRIWSIVCMTVAALLASTEAGQELLEEVMYSSYWAGNMGYSSAYAPGLYVIFCIASILASFVLAPLTYKPKCGIGKFLFLTIITGGIWELIWIYQVTKHLNAVEGQKTRKPIAELLLCIFLPFYYVYWNYNTARIMDAYAAQKGIESKLDILCLVFGVVVPPVSAILLQDKLNTILDAE